MDSQTGSPGLNSCCVVDLLYPCCCLFAALAILDVTKLCSDGLSAWFEKLQVICATVEDTHPVVGPHGVAVEILMALEQ